jgi:hypothetical protein
MLPLGFATGWRPSMMKPLCQEGPSAHVLWDNSKINVGNAQALRNKERMIALHALLSRDRGGSNALAGAVTDAGLATRSVLNI